MTKIILISHNKLAQGMRQAVEMIAGPQKNLTAYGLMVGQRPDDVIASFADQLPRDEQVLILADFVGGSMCNAAMALLQRPNVRLIGGMNMGLVLQLVLEPTADIDHVISSAREGLKEVKLAKVESDGNFF